MRKVLIVVVVATVVVLVTGAGWSQVGPVGVKSTVLTQTTKTIIGQNIEYPLFRPQITAVLFELAPGGQTGRHMHPVPELVYLLEGTITTAIEGQGEKVFGPGQTLVEPVNTWHNSTNRGTTTVKALAVFVGEEGKPTRINP